jgi:hypothetical protein
MSPEEGSLEGKGWYRTNDIRTMTCSRDMEIWVPKSGNSFSQESMEEVWEAWRNDAPKDECKVQLEGRWWALYGWMLEMREESSVRAPQGNYGNREV